MDIQEMSNHRLKCRSAHGVNRDTGFATLVTCARLYTGPGSDTVQAAVRKRGHTLYETRTFDSAEVRCHPN